MHFNSLLCFHYSITLFPLGPVSITPFVFLRSLSRFFLYFLAHITSGHSVLVKTIMCVFPLVYICPFSYPLHEPPLKLRSETVFAVPIKTKRIQMIPLFG